jgi:hypothetical protein
VADDWCWFVVREKYCWLVAGGWFVVREKYCWLVADKPSEQGAEQSGAWIRWRLEKVLPNVIAEKEIEQFRRNKLIGFYFQYTTDRSRLTML